MPLPPEEAENGENAGNEEPKLQFSYVECLLYSFHQLGRKLPDFLTAKLNAEKLKDFKIRWCMIEVVQSLAKVMAVFILPWVLFSFYKSILPPLPYPSGTKWKIHKTGIYVNIQHLWHNKSMKENELQKWTLAFPNCFMIVGRFPNLLNSSAVFFSWI